MIVLVQILREAETKMVLNMQEMRCPTDTKKMLNIANQRNANQTIIRYHLIPPRTAIIQRHEIISVGEDMEKGTLTHCWWERNLVQTLRKYKGLSKY